jgi:hypothetical protein
MGNVKDYADWVHTMIKNPIVKRKQWVSDIMNGLRKGIGKTKKNPKEAQNLADLLSDKSKFELIGFSANLHYIKDNLRKGDTDEDLECVFVHPWGSPKLLFKHKDLPVLFIVGDDLRLDESVINEVDKNEKVDVRGFTG